MRGEGGGRGGARGAGAAQSRAAAAATDEDAVKPPSPLDWARVRELVKVFWPYFWPKGWVNRVSTLSCFVSLGLSKVCEITAPIFLGRAMDAMTRQEFPLMEIIIFGILRFGVSTFEEVQRLVYLRVKQAAYHETAVAAFRHIHSLSLHWHINKRSGVVMKAMDRGISSASTVVDMLVLRMGPSIIEMFVVAIIFNAVYHSTGAAWSLAVTFVAYCLATFILSRRRARLRQTMHRADNEANQIAVDTLTGFETVKTFTNENYELQRYSDAVKGFQVASREQQASYVTLNITQSLIIRMSTVSVLIFGAKDVLDGKMSAGGFVALLSYVGQLYAPLSWLGAMYNMVVSAYTDMMNLTDLMQEQPDIRDAPGAHQLRIGEGEGASIEFKDVVFQYPAQALDRIESTMERTRRTDATLAAPAPGFFARVGAFFTRRQYQGIEQGDVEMGQVDSAAPAASPELQPTLRGISFNVRAGTTTAIVGPTGSGKSTVSKLLFRFYDVTSGSIRVNGQDINTLGQVSLRRAIGMVPQDCVLFNNTIRFNIKYGRPEASDEEMKAAASLAQISQFVDLQPNGYDTKVGERGLRLSGGEKQRIAIARTLLKNPPILVLDEATSSLDTITEAQIQSALNHVRSGRTVLCIAHRLSTIKDADEILVLANGVIEERGTHENLLSMNGRYAALWKQQAAAAIAAPVILPEATKDKPVASTE